jgi:hypothetical protein
MGMAMGPRIWFNDICIKTGGKKILQGEWLFRVQAKYTRFFANNFSEGLSQQESIELVHSC